MEKRGQKYQEQAIKNASPTELITKLYDFAIQACYKKDVERLHGSLQILIDSLNHDFEISASLYNLYEYCQRQARDNKFEEVRELLEPVRETWKDEVVGSNPDADMNMQIDTNKQPAQVASGQGFVV